MIKAIEQDLIPILEKITEEAFTHPSPNAPMKEHLIHLEEQNNAIVNAIERLIVEVRKTNEKI